MKNYRYRLSIVRIEKFEVVKETAKTVWFLDGNGIEFAERKETDNISWHKSISDCFDFARSKQQLKIERMKNHLHKEIQHIDKLNEIQKNNTNQEKISLW
jgi:hypothetical protein